ncbi:PTS mannitol transporter subunit IICB [Sediminispirochaeta smaragdinae]|uniref:protein-N(pi)-phosphohistidine--D-mannitol phosphotransferase n=1 Tax=Sediminispirochaeta smaragdinae (strain DSM 11293 / JCM 15392 / SEBR 4228) TaxID=573413 RepID=E1R7E3_SEDSS|nr:PTS mannitol transporter subunit IICBA [Sediminispirochaeta smaragdinae]ADK82648.1 PTS system, mannitol-specific IIC subunit [Sediminispirochaeta smaragdinae DSM 11293]
MEGAAIGARSRIQRFGRFLSGMVMPNIGAFIAWGLITAFFIATGWTPNERLATLVGPMISYMLPLLIGFTGGRMIWNIRGGVVGAVATMGVIVGADIPMFIGAMIMGPVGGIIIKKFDQAVEPHIPVGFEMLINNFSAGIIGMLLALFSFLLINPVVLGITHALQAGVGAIIQMGLLPLVSLFVEPAKILFLNNAINHGIFSPLGIAQVQETGRSIYFLLETNPGPGLGVLLAYLLFSKGAVKDSTPGAIIIHFFGGIHEIYFPYVLMNPILLLAVIAGGASGVAVFSLFGAGEVATPSPGSIFALMAVSPKGGQLPILLGVIISTAVSFVVAMPFVRRFALRQENADASLAQAKSQVQNIKNLGKVRKIVFACDAGMGSSAMGANRLKKKLKAAGVEVEVLHSSVDDIPQDAQLVISHVNLSDRAKESAPNARHFSITNFVNAPEYDDIVKELAESEKE